MTGSLRQRLSTRELICALEISSASPGAIEMAAGLDFDLLVIDARHAPVSAYSDELERLVRAADAHGVEIVARVVANTPGTINRAMNDGAFGVVVGCETGGEALQAVRSMRYPPDGFRGAAPVVRAARYGLTAWQEYVQTTNGSKAAIVSVESTAALGRARDIARVDGVDALLFDLFNLSVSAGHLIRQPGDDPDVDAAVLAAAETVAPGVAVVDPLDAAAWVEFGCSLVVLGTDVAAYAAEAVALRRSLDDVPTVLASVSHD